VDLVRVAVDPEAQQVRVIMVRTAEDGQMACLTLTESETLVKRLGEENAKLRVAIARDGDKASVR
jgi:hypothetical protein